MRAQGHKVEVVATEEIQLRISHILLSSRTHPHHPLSPGSWRLVGPVWLKAVRWSSLPREPGTEHLSGSWVPQRHTALPTTPKPQQARDTAQLTVSIQGNLVPDSGSQVLRPRVWNTCHSYSDTSSTSPKMIKPDQGDSCVDCRLPSTTHYKPGRILPQAIRPKTQMLAKELFLILKSLSRHFHQKSKQPKHCRVKSVKKNPTVYTGK